ncbi:MAG: MATE family efflux transporter [Lachnospiraceae bacterium]|nr:MATE family efflux transporter [Lachnospiraceae bacterium]
MNKDLTVGQADKVLWRFCLPLFVSIIFQQLYNIADSLVAGKFIGENALAAVGNSYEITLIFLAFAFGCNIGCSVIVSTFFGAGRYRELKTTVSTSMIATGIVCLILMLTGLLFCDGLLNMINTPPEVFADSKLYLDIYIWGLPFVFFYNVSTGIFSALGDSKTPLLFLTASSCINIVMDICFVAGFKMGVGGVALATFICQGISCFLALLVVFKRLKRFKLEERVKLFSFDILKKIAKVAIPSILQQSFISVGNIVIQGTINGFGPGVMAGYSAAIKLNNLVISSFTTIGNGISNYTAQNLGAGKKERIILGFKAGRKMVWILCIPLVFIYLVLGKWLLLLFMKEPSDLALDTGLMILRILVPFYFVISVKLVADGILRGAKMMGKFMTSTMTDLFLRVTLAIIFSKSPLGATGIWCSWPIGWCVATAMSVFFYKSGRWERSTGKGAKEE